MSDIAVLVADNLDIWTGAIERKSGASRGGGSKRISLYGIERLRALILNLAVRGKLVPQEVGDQPALDQLANIRTSKPKYIKEHGIPKSRVSPDAIDQVPFALPGGWAWSRLGDIAAYIQRGKSPKYSEGSGVYVVSQRCVQWSGLDLTVAKEISQASLSNYESYRFLKPGDLLWNSTGTGTIGRVIALDEVPDGLVCDSHVTLVRCPWMNARYLQAWLASDDVYGQIEALAAGSTNQIEWTAQLANNQLVPLPPLAEQSRIVAKIDELMALCNALERESEDALAEHQTLVETLLATLVSSADATDLAANWARLESHFDTLFTTEASIDALKQTILDLAVRGRLVEQDAGEGDASDLLKKIVASNAERVAAGGAKKMRSKSDTPSGVGPFDVPSSWAWTTLDRIAYKLTDGAHHTPTYTDEGVPFLSVKDMSSGTLDFSDTRFISAEQHAELYRRCDAERGDLLITKVGTTGVPIIVDTDQPFSLFVSVALVKAPWELVSVEYLRLLVDSPFVRRQSAEGTQGIGNKNLVLRTIGAFRIPFPPLAEQHRIVAKVDELMALCNALKARLADSAETRRHLADAIVERAAA